MNGTRHSRGGFSLIELLVVIGIMTVLAALAAGTYFRIRSSQQVNSTEATMKKVDTGLERLYSGVRDQAEKEFTTGNLIAGVTMERLLGFAGGPNEKDRAKAIYLYFRLKYEFPQTFPEAKANLVLPGIINAQSKQMFKNVPNVTPTNANEANLQAAALLYIILLEKSSKGETFDMQTVNGFVAERPIGTAGNFQCIIDSWGTPITYVRFLTNSEIDEQPYARIGGGQTFQNPAALPVNVSNSPFDVSGRLTASWSNFTTFCTAAGVATQIPAANRQEQLLRRNFIPSVVSAGADKEWDGFDVRGFNASPYSNIGIVQFGTTAGTDGNDNVLGYRLRRLGARGD